MQGPSFVNSLFKEKEKKARVSEDVKKNPPLIK